MLRAKWFLIAASLVASLVGSTRGQEQIPWITNLGQARQLAEQQQRVVLLHFWSDSCPPCRLLEQNVFNQPELIRVISAGFIPVKINVLQQTKYAEFYKVDRVPMDILVDHTGKELYRSTSPQKVDGYLSMLDQVRSQVAVNAGRSLEAMAQNHLQKFNSALPPMAGTQDESGSSEPINSDPRDVFPNAQPWQSVPANAGPTDQRPQSAHMQNHFATADPNSTPQPAQVSSRHENPYFDASSPVTQEKPAATSQANNPSRPWETASSAVQNTLNLSNLPIGSDPSAPPSMSPNMSPPAANIVGKEQLSAGPKEQLPASPMPGNSGSPLPNNVPPMALDGYCPVTLVLLSKWTKGDPRWGAIHRGRTYLLGSQADQQRFLADPDRFSPAVSGYDPVRFTETGQLVEGKREHGLFLTNSYYLFADEGSLSRFESHPQGYVNAVRQAMSNARPGAQR